VQHADGRYAGKSRGEARGPRDLAGHALLVGLTGASALLLVGCSSGSDLLTSVALPSEQSRTLIAHDGLPSLTAGEENQAGKVDVTPGQRAYLDALHLAGIFPSSDLRALSIGSSVCQAHAAGQSDEAVWDYIAPMVRSDVADAVPSPRSASDIQVNTVTADYIRIATQRLC
jgi:hypothetical protein